MWPAAGTVVFLYATLCSFCFSTILEDILETEIDTREPRRFIRPNEDDLLCARPPFGFAGLECYNPDGSQWYSHIPNWEVFAVRYWYETRTSNCSCPMPPAGFSKYMDWALMVPCLFGNMNVPPRTIYIHHYMISHFVESTLHFMEPHHRFVLVSGGTDMTIPQSVDLRYHTMRGFSHDPSGGSYFQRLVNDPRLIHWFCENHDLVHPKVSTLPTGMSVPNIKELRADYPAEESLPPLLSRAPKVVVADRTRNGQGQWALRANVRRMCLESDICATSDRRIDGDGGTDHPTFVKLVTESRFVACTRGGGLDPSPKAWETLLLGAIPIIQHSPLDDGYEHFPVLFVNRWEDIFQNPNISVILEAQAKRLAPYFEKGSALRAKVLYKLKSEYWLSKIADKVRDYDKAHPGEAAALHDAMRRSLAPEAWRNRRVASNETLGTRSGPGVALPTYPSGIEKTAKPPSRPPTKKNLRKRRRE